MKLKLDVACCRSVFHSPAILSSVNTSFMKNSCFSNLINHHLYFCSLNNLCLKSNFFLSNSLCLKNSLHSKNNLCLKNSLLLKNSLCLQTFSIKYLYYNRSIICNSLCLKNNSCSQHNFHLQNSLYSQI